MNLFHKTSPSATILSLEDACSAVFGPSGPSTHCPDVNVHELDRQRALARAAIAMAHLETLGLSCGVFGSALRPGDFFHNSDVDFAAWLPDQAPLGSDLAMAARLACHRSMAGTPFDLVLLPCTNVAFGQRILDGWTRGRSEVERASRGEPLSSPLAFGPADVAFIDRDRLDIAQRAAARMSASFAGASDADASRITLSLCASMHTALRVAEKCAKDILRQFVGIQPPRAETRPLYPLLAYPCDALGGRILASETSVRLYLECSELAGSSTTTLDPLGVGWPERMAMMAQLFVSSMRVDLEPALVMMACLPHSGGTIEAPGLTSP